MADLNFAEYAVPQAGNQGGNRSGQNDGLCAD